MPQEWAQFIALDENKENLAYFISNHLINYSQTLPPDKEIVTGGGFFTISCRPFHQKEVLYIICL